MSIWSSVAMIEPGLGRRDQQFFELAATLIPIFFLAGTIGGLAERSRPKPTFKHLSVAFGLLAFLLVEIFAELVSVEALVTGFARDWNRYLALAALILGMWASGFALLWPFVEKFYVSGTFQETAVVIVLTVLIGAVTSVIGVFTVFNAVFDVTQEERALQRTQKEDQRRRSNKKEIQQLGRSTNHLLRLNIRFARICRNGPLGGWRIEEHLALHLVKQELREYLRNHHLKPSLKPNSDPPFAWLEGGC